MIIITLEICVFLLNLVFFLASFVLYRYNKKLFCSFVDIANERLSKFSSLYNKIKFDKDEKIS